MGEAARRKGTADDLELLSVVVTDQDIICCMHVDDHTQYSGTGLAADQGAVGVGSAGCLLSLFVTFVKSCSKYTTQASGNPSASRILPRAAFPPSLSISLFTLSSRLFNTSLVYSKDLVVSRR